MILLCLHKRSEDHRDPDLPSVGGWVEALIFIALSIAIMAISLSRYWQ